MRIAPSSVQSLLGAVRRRLWSRQFVAAARLALWSTAGFMLLAVAVYLTARPVPVGAGLLAIVVLWASLLGWAGLRRPSDSACALWADRHLGGQSAFITLLEMRKGTQIVQNAQALRWLEHWATARVPYGLRLLAERHDSARVSRSLLSMLVCTALATLVLTLPDLPLSSRQQLATSSPSAIPDRPTPDDEPPIATALVGELANALRSAAPHHASDRRETSRAPAAKSAKSDDGNGSRMVQPGSAQPGERATVRKSLPGNPNDAAPTVGATQASGAGSGRDAGDSRDERAGTGVSRALRSTMLVQKRESSVRRSSRERQADMDQLASFDDDLSVHRAATVREDAAPAAATPPPATEAMRLTPTEATYVQAWLKASGQRR